MVKLGDSLHHDVHSIWCLERPKRVVKMHRIIGEVDDRAGKHNHSRFRVRRRDVIRIHHQVAESEMFRGRRFSVIRILCRIAAQ